jgi:hypothetical protein
MERRVLNKFIAELSPVFKIDTEHTKKQSVIIQWLAFLLCIEGKNSKLNLEMCCHD